MSGTSLSRALHDRFESIRRSEIERLGPKKLRGFTDEERRVVDAVTADLVRALARVPEDVQGAEVPRPALDAMIQLFGL